MKREKTLPGAAGREDGPPGNQTALPSGLFHVAAHAVDTGLSVFLGDDLRAGVNELFHFFTLEILYHGFDSLVADIEIVLCCGHGQLAADDCFAGGNLAVKAKENGVCVVGVCSCGACRCNRHIIVIGADDRNAVRVLGHDRFHADNSLVSNSVCILYFSIQEFAAGFVNAFAEAFHTGGVGCVALYTGDFDALDIGPAGSLCSFYGCDCALLGRFSVTGADERDDLVGFDTGIECNDRLVGVGNLGCDCLGLERCNQITVKALDRKSVV